MRFLLALESSTGLLIKTYDDTRCHRKWKQKKPAPGRRPAI